MLSTEYYVESISKDVHKLAEKIKELEKSNHNLKTPHGQFKSYEPYDSEKKYFDVTNDIEWSKYEALFKKDLEKAEQNEKILSDNQKILSNLVAMIEASGVKSEYKELKRSKWVTVTMQWKTALSQGMPSFPGTQRTLRNSYDEKVRRRNEALLKKEQESREKEKQQRIKEQERAQIKAIVEVSIALGLDSKEQDIYSLKEELTQRCKYLDLSTAMLDTRNDWNDGAYRVEHALNRFKVVTDDDKKIYAELRDILDDFEDGRAFRDCKWNYDVVGSLGDKKIADLWNRLNV